MDKHFFLRPSSDSVTEARAINLSCDLFAPAISEPNGQRKKKNNQFISKAMNSKEQLVIQKTCF